MLNVLRSAAALIAVAGCLVCGGCGASAAHDQPPAGTSTTQKADRPPAAGSAPASPKSAPASPGSVSAAAAIARKCVAVKASDPGQFTVCLASHGIKLPDSGALTACIQGAHDPAALQACLTKGAR
jgi:hypothetical protein